MKKWFVLIILAGVIVLATTVLAVRETITEVPAKEAAGAPAGDAASYRGCGGRSSGCGSSGGISCCGGSQAGGKEAAARMESLRVSIYNIYAGKLNDPDITVTVKDFGCHQEAYVMKGDKVLKKLSISGGRVDEIS